MKPLRFTFMLLIFLNACKVEQSPCDITGEDLRDIVGRSSENAIDILMPCMSLTRDEYGNIFSKEFRENDNLIIKLFDTGDLEVSTSSLETYTYFIEELKRYYVSGEGKHYMSIRNNLYIINNGKVKNEYKLNIIKTN